MPVFFHFVGRVLSITASSAYRDANVIHQDDEGQQQLVSLNYYASPENDLVADMAYLFTGTAILDLNDQPKVGCHNCATPMKDLTMCHQFQLTTSTLLPLELKKLPKSKINMIAAVTITSPPVAIENNDMGESLSHFQACMWEYDIAKRREIQVS
jgi:hypothetical protein